MKLSIIILNYKSFSELDGALQALQQFPSRQETEIIIVDNNSDQPLEEKAFLETWGRGVRFIKNAENVGFGKGNNIGVAQAFGQYLLVHNPDVRVWEGALDEAIGYLETHPTVGILGGQLRFPEGTIQDSYRTFPSLFDQVIKRAEFLRRHRSLRRRVSTYLMWEKDPSVTESVDWVVGGFMFIRKKAFEALNGFDERYFLFMEDVDLCRQMWMHGWQVVYHPTVKATHNEHRLSEGGFLELFTRKTLRIHLASACKYFWKYKFIPHPRAKR
ncbi:MAG: family 2 glycosyl transferase [Candidatus Peregrinibacteria bacterium GW2011_GWA2_47_7]|nr:MAG: family 2 glycosyl transferase [Candidatus Peregrinibacteria bacterium GW2011_GWA2_47_7]